MLNSLPRETCSLGSTGEGGCWRRSASGSCPCSGFRRVTFSEGRVACESLPGGETQTPHGPPRNPEASSGLHPCLPDPHSLPVLGATSYGPVLLPTDAGQCGSTQQPAHRGWVQTARRCVWPGQVTSLVCPGLSVPTLRVPHPRNTLCLCTPVRLVTAGHSVCRPGQATAAGGRSSPLPRRRFLPPPPGDQGLGGVLRRSGSLVPSSVRGLHLCGTDRGAQLLGLAVWFLTPGFLQSSAMPPDSAQVGCAISSCCSEKVASSMMLPSQGLAADWALARVLGLCPLRHFLAA